MSKISMGLVLFAAVLGGCAESRPEEVRSALDGDAAWTLAENALVGFNDGDYDAWTHAWSDDMKAGIDRPAFLDIRDVVLEVSGEWQTIDDQALVGGDHRGTVRWTFDTTFEKEPVVVWFAFEEDGTEVIGVMFESEGLDGA